MEPSRFTNMEGQRFHGEGLVHHHDHTRRAGDQNKEQGRTDLNTHGGSGTLFSNQVAITPP